MSGAEVTSKDERNVTVVVNGEPHEILANENQQISVIIKHALKAAEQTRPVEHWELRSDEGDQAQVLDPRKKLRDYGLVLPITLFLNLQTGGGGAV